MNAMPMEWRPTPLALTLPIESPFGWKAESLTFGKEIPLFPNGENLTISWTATRISKLMAYIPIIGIFIGINRIREGIQEHNHFNRKETSFLTDRSIQWIVRGITETVPIIGGLICLIADLICSSLPAKEPHMYVARVEQGEYRPVQ